MKMEARRATTIASILSLLATTAIAQDDSVEIEEIIVTATKRDVLIQDVPFNISAFEEQRLKEANLLEIDRLSQEVPGLNVVNYGTENPGEIVLRGMNATRLQVWSLPVGTTSVYLDDTLLDYTHLDMDDLSRVEVLRGPQGTLYGGGAVGGTIRFVTNRPDPNRFDGWVQAGFSDTTGSSSTGWDAAAVLNAPLVDGKLGLRTVGSYREEPGFITKIGYPDRPGLPTIYKEDQNSNNRLSVRTALRWIPREDLEMTAAYLIQRLDSEGNGGATPEVGGTYTGVGGVVDESTEEDLDLFTLDVVADFGFAELTSNSAYYDEDRSRIQDHTRYIGELSESIGLNYEQFPEYFEYLSPGIHKKERFTQEFRLLSKTVDTIAEYIVGAFYLDQTDDGGPNVQVAPGLPDFLNDFYFGPGAMSDRPDSNEFVGQGHTEATELAVFGEVKFDISDSLDIVLGGRWFDYEISGYTDVAFPIDEELLDKFGVPSCTPTQGGIDATQFGCTHEHTELDNQVDDFVYKFNMSYQFDRVDALLFATVAEGFRPGGANYVNSVQAEIIDPRFFGYDPDKATSYELGIKTILMNKRIMLNGGIYRIDWEGIQLGTRVGAGFDATVNGDDAQMTGFELDLSALLTRDWSLDISLAWLDAELKSDTVTTPEVDGQEGDRLPGSAELQALLALRYETMLANDSNLWVRVAGSYSGDVTTYLNNNPVNQLISPPELSENRFFDRLPSYTIWNLTSGIEREHWSLLAYAENLFDEQYIVASSTFELGPVDDPISRQHYYGRPRTVGVRLRRSF
jgi:outer membrane receptor protein involved in Fe transport